MRVITFFFITFLFFSCNKPYIEKPKDLLSKSEMVDILVDLYTNQQLVNAIPTQSGTPTLNLANNAVYIFENHETTTKIFEESYKYYFSDPKTYNSILDDVKVELTSRLSEEEKNRLKEIESSMEESK